MTVGPKIAADREGPGLAYRRRAGPGTSTSRWLRASVASFGLASLFVAVESAALGLGAATVSSGLGDPLRMSIPVTLQADEEVGCVQVRPHGDDLPSVFNTRSQVLRSGTQTRIEIRSAAPVDEPAIGLVVSVGCASPVARDYVLFLDPPVVGATPADETATTPSPAAIVAPARRNARTRQADSSPATSGAAAQSTRPPRPVRRRAPATAASTTASPVSSASPSPPATAPTGRVRVPSGGDRLSVMPTEPPVIGRTSPSPQPGVFPPAVSGMPPSGSSTGASPATSATPPIAGVAGVAATGEVPVAAASAPSPATDADASAREEALRQQQAALQLQIKSLSDQIAALRVQTTSLAARNQALEGTAFSPLLVWLLIALAVVAIIVAGWMAWRYTQLRRSLEGSAWWTNQAAQDDAGFAEEPRVAGYGAPATTGATRSVVRPATTAAETRSQLLPAAATSSSAQISNIDRIRPAVRAPGSTYPAAMDTDFTVSDIEAAMATVRTVSPPRTGKPVDPLEDTDFAGLGGPTITSPFDEAPPTAAPLAKPADEDPAHFVDLDIPPIQPLTAAPPRTQAPVTKPVTLPPAVPVSSNPAESATSSAVEPAATPDLDFKFDIPENFDPLASDSMKTTVFNRPDADAGNDEHASVPSALDFELPSQTQIISMTALDRGVGTDAPRHGGTALDDLFAPIGADGPDTILDLDERDGAPLSTTEVDRFAATEMAPSTSFIGLSERNRMARFADLMTRVDDIASSEPLRAIAHLRQYVLRDEHIPTLLWLRLFELYKIVDKRQVHDALAEHFARRYHRPMIGWTETLADRTPQRPLSALVEIDSQVESQWGTAAGVAYLAGLLCDRDREDAIVFNAVLQRDLLDAAKIFPEPPETGDDKAGPHVENPPQ